MCSLVTKKDYNKEMQSQQSFHIDHIEYARNSYSANKLALIIYYKDRLLYKFKI